MRFLVDTNVLLYAANKPFPQHQRAHEFLQPALEGEIPWCLTWPIVYEFLRVCTHPRVFPRPLTSLEAEALVGSLLDSPTLTMLSPTSRHHHVLKQTLAEIASPAGNIFHDIAIAVTMREHGVGEIATADADFLQFKFLKVTNPVGSRK